MTLLEIAKSKGVRIPTVRTLNIYGLTLDEWLTIMDRQGWQCPICLKTEAHWNIDHHHVMGFKKMPPRERASYVRGVLCSRCNHTVVNSYITAEDAWRMAQYVEDYYGRRAEWLLKNQNSK